jgi:hypothetical protein
MAGWIIAVYGQYEMPNCPRDRGAGGVDLLFGRRGGERRWLAAEGGEEDADEAEGGADFMRHSWCDILTKKSRNGTGSPVNAKRPGLRPDFC